LELAEELLEDVRSRAKPAAERELAARPARYC